MATSRLLTPRMKSVELGQPQPAYWERRRLSGREVRRLIAELDPVANDVEIAHLSLEVLTPPLAAHLVYLAGFARTMGDPRTAGRIWRNGTGDQIRDSLRRDQDTLTFLGEFMRRGYRTAAGQAAFDRVQSIHRQVKGVLNVLQVHVLGCLIFEYERVARHFGLTRWFSDRQNEAWFNFWIGVARGMRLRDVPKTRPEFGAWMDEFEAQHFRPSEAAVQVVDALVRGWTSRFPAPLRPTARAILIESMADHVRELLGYRRPPRRLILPALQAAHLYLAATPALPHRLDRTWVRSFSHLGPTPDINRLGHQPNPAG